MSNTLLIMIDDTDSGISYSGGWVADKGSLDNLGNFGAPYMSTSHYTKGTGSFTYTFTGTYVGVFGSSVDGKDPSRTCTVDGVTIPNNQISSEVNEIMHCQVNGLADGKHTLVVSASNNANGYWFDYLMYIPSSSVSRTNAALMVIWGDPSISYGSGWSQNGPGNAATVNGASVTVQFTGRSLTWMGYYLSQFPSAATTATYTVDGGSPVSFDLNGIQAQSTGAELNQRFFTTGLIPAGQHTLKVTYNGNSGTTPLSIYNLIIQNGASAGASVGGSIGASHPATVTVTNNNGGGASTITTTPSAASSQLSSSVVVIGTGASAVTVTVSDSNSTATLLLPNPSASVTGSTTQTNSGSGPISSDKASSSGGASADANSDTSSNTSNTSNPNTASSATGVGHSHVGPIVGAIVGVLALLLLLLLVFFLRRRNRKRREGAPAANTSRTNLVVDPFTVPPTAFPPAMSEVSDHLSSSGGIYASLPTTQFYSDVKRPLPADDHENAAGPSSLLWGSQPILHQPSHSISTFSSPATATTDAPESEVIMLHEDSGVRIPMNQTIHPGLTVVEMPPTYSAT